MIEQPLKQVGDLQVDEDLDFEERGWIAQRVAWCLMAAVVLAALFGLFGNGPLSHAKASDSSGRLRIEYDRFIRSQAPVDLRLTIGGDAIDSRRQVHVWLSDELFENMELKIITPPPHSVANGAGGSIHTFDAAPNADDLHIWFRFDARQIGSIEFDVGLADPAGGRPGELVRLRQFAYP